MRETDLTRRGFLRRTAVLGAVTVGSTAVLAGCGGDQTGGTTGGGETAELKCDDTSALKPEEVTVRTSLQYKDKSELPDKLCSNCQQYVAAADASACGTCKVVPGTINPGGHCTAWVQKTT